MSLSPKVSPLNEMSALLGRLTKRIGGVERVAHRHESPDVIQSGIAAVTTGVDGGFQITFPSLFVAASLPVISATIGSASNDDGYYVTVTGSLLDETSFSGKVWDGSNGTAIGSTAVVVHWIAVGPPS